MGVRLGAEPVRTLNPGMTHGTTTYMPPELLQHGQLSFAVDAYSFGVLRKHLACCKLAEYCFEAETVLNELQCGLACFLG